MRLVTFRLDGEERIGVVLDDSKVLDLSRAVDGRDGPFPTTMLGLIRDWDAARDVCAGFVARPPSSAIVPLTRIDLLAPIPRPTKNVFCVGRNYKEHIAEGDRAQGVAASAIPEFPQFFTKAPTCVIGPDADIPNHAATTSQLDYEVELAVVIGREGRDIPRARAMAHVFGFTILNDVTGRDLQRRHGQWFKGKSLDGSCPMGPWIVTADALDPLAGVGISLSVNGARRQSATTADMIWDVPAILEQLSRGMTLEPGDIVATGTPSGVGYAMTPPRFLAPGDRIEASIGGIGTLVNRVAAA